MVALAPDEAEIPRRRRGRLALWSSVAVGVVVVALIALLATRDPSGTRLANSPLLGKFAPDVSGQSIIVSPDGSSVPTFELGDQEGRWVIVNFFATWCVPCQEEQDDLVTLVADHAEADDLRVVSIVFSDTAANVERYFAERGGDWPVIDDPDGQMITDWGVTAVPESYIVDPNGYVRAKITGGVTSQRIEQLLVDLGGAS